MGLAILKPTGHPAMSLNHQEGAPVPSPLLGLLSAATHIPGPQDTHLFIWAWSCSSLEPSSRGQLSGSPWGLGGLCLGLGGTCCSNSGQRPDASEMLREGAAAAGRKGKPELQSGWFQRHDLEQSPSLPLPAMGTQVGRSGSLYLGALEHKVLSP